MTLWARGSLTVTCMARLRMRLLGLTATATFATTATPFAGGAWGSTVLLMSRPALLTLRPIVMRLRATLMRLRTALLHLLSRLRR